MLYEYFFSLLRMLKICILQCYGLMTLIFFSSSTSTFLSETDFPPALRLCGSEEYLLLLFGVIALNHAKV